MKQTKLGNLIDSSSSSSSSPTHQHQHQHQHQHHHSAPPSHYQTPRPGLDAINENLEYNNAEQVTQSTPIQSRFPRSSTVPYPAHTTLKKTSPGNAYFSPIQYYYTDYSPLVHETISPVQQTNFLPTRQPLSLVNTTNFQPISPHHHQHHQHQQQYGQRPVDVLKPTFLIVPKAAEQRLAAQLSASNSPVPPSPKTKSMPKKIEKKSPSTVRHSESQTTNGTDMSTRHVGLLATPNPSPYVYFGSPSYSNQSAELSRTGPPESSIMQDEMTQTEEYYHGSTSVHSIPNMTFVQASPQQFYSSSISRQYHLTQVASSSIDEQQQQQQQEAQGLGNNESTHAQSPPPPPAASSSSMNGTAAKLIDGSTRLENDQTSVTSLDFAHLEPTDVPGSWRIRSVPIRTVARRHRAPIPAAFLEPQHYVSDSEQVVVPSISYRQQQIFGSIPTIHRPFDSIRSQNPYQFAPAIRLSEIDVLKVAAFYRSMGTLVYVARSLATLYSSDFDAMANLKDWKKLYTGVPIWLFNTGLNPKRSRSIRLIISEFGSSFTLWDTIVNGASDVRLPKARHMTLKSLETGTILALKFDDTTATEEFHQYFVKLSCDPRNADLFDLFNVKRRRPRFELRKRKIKKSAISKPTKFNHINKVDENDRESLYTFSVLVDENLPLN